MDEKLYKTARVRNITVKYFIITEFLENKIPVYGIRIEYGEESVVIKNPSLSLQDLSCLTDLLARGKVTPVTAPDIVEDWLIR